MQYNAMYKFFRYVINDVKESLHTSFIQKKQTLEIHKIIRCYMYLNSKISQYCLKVYCSVHVVLFEWLHASILSTDLHCKCENHLAELYKQNHLKILLNSIQDWVTSEVNLPVHDLWGICSSQCQPNVSCVFHKQHFRDWT